jgi:hypothetical protein
MQFYNYVAVSVLTMVTKAGWPYINVTKNKYFTLLTLCVLALEQYWVPLLQQHL